MSAPRETGYASAILHEIAEMLARLAAEGSGGVVDLRAMPLAPADRARLEEVLPPGVVKVSVEAGGASEIFETVHAGVWWIRHRNPAGETISEFIEVTDCPQFLRSQPGDIREAMSGLRRLIE